MPRRYKPLFYVKSHLVDNRLMKPENRRWYSRQRAPFLVKDYARQISRKLAAIKNVDIICSGPHGSSQPVAYLECKQPIVIWNDGLFADVLDFYPEYSRDRTCKESIADGIANEGFIRPDPQAQSRLGTRCRRGIPRNQKDHLRCHPHAVSPSRL